MKTAKQQAEAVKEEDRQAVTKEKLSAAAANKKKAAKQLEIKLTEAEAALIQFIETVPLEHKQAAVNTQVKVNKLILELKDGVDVNDIVIKLNKLRV